MEMPDWNSMDQKQRIMAIGAGVVLLVAIALIARGIFGGGGSAPPVDTAAMKGIQGAVDDGTIKTPPPVNAPEDLEPIQRKGAVPSGG